MKKARIIIGANYGDEGKGTVTAHYTKNSEGSVINVLTNGGSQRGHSILTKDGNITYQHFGSGTYYGADNYYSRFFILNPMQFVKEYNSLIVKPKNIYRDIRCLWTTPYDSMANLTTERMHNRKASCCMGIWNTIRRSREISAPFDYFIDLDDEFKKEYLKLVKRFYEKEILVPADLYDAWNGDILIDHFINDCKFLYNHTQLTDLLYLDNYDNYIFENGQGLLLSDKGVDTYDTTPSNTGIEYALRLMEGFPDLDVTAHYVTRPYLTRHGDGYLLRQDTMSNVSSDIKEDRTNHSNEFQGDFRYGELDIEELKKRIALDAGNVKYELDITHCDEMDRMREFRLHFTKINMYDSPLIR